MDARAHAMLQLAQSMSWGDVDSGLVDMELALKRALDATAVDLVLWERDCAGENTYGDEFSVTEEDLEEMSPEWKLAYIARLLRTAALRYGVNTDLLAQVSDTHAHNVGGNDEHSPAALLRGLNDIVHLGWAVTRS
jgi:hypothetical protein